MKQEDYTHHVEGMSFPSRKAETRSLAGRFQLDDSPLALAVRQEKKHGVFPLMLNFEPHLNTE